MASDTITKLLQEAADMARREGYAEGFAAAVAAMGKFVSSLSSEAVPTQSTERNSSHTPPLVRRIRRPDNKTFVPRMSAGVLNQIVADAYKSILPDAASPTVIQIWIRDNARKELAFTSLRRAIDRLTSTGVLEEIDGTKTWRYREGRKTEAPGGGTPGTSNPSGVVTLRK
jgi:hypothetical protein